MYTAGSPCSSPHLAMQSPLAQGLVVPSSLQHADFMRVIEGLPSSNSPSQFGLPANIDRMAQRASSTNVLNLLRAMSKVRYIADWATGSHNVAIFPQLFIRSFSVFSEKSLFSCSHAIYLCSKASLTIATIAKNGVAAFAPLFPCGRSCQEAPT